SVIFFTPLFPYESGLPLDSPPFPTRRSSDLDEGGGRVARIILFDELAQNCFGVLLLDGVHHRRGCFINSLPVRDEPGAAGGVTGDRKSTRLNSSHQIISYAVFCLKKKKA